MGREEEQTGGIGFFVCLFVFAVQQHHMESEFPRPGMEPVPLDGAQGLNHWTTESPMTGILRTLGDAPVSSLLGRSCGNVYGFFTTRFHSSTYLCAFVPTL